MIDKNLKCPKCNGEMVQGFVPDYSHGATIVSAWQEGQPKKSFWRRTQATFSKGIPIGAFRCHKCGFLELYADTSFAAA